MKGYIRVLVVLLLMYYLNCYATSFGLPAGVLLNVNSKGATYATEDNPEAKKGIACVNSILGLLAVGDASINTAAVEGNIRKKIISVSRTQEGVLGIYQKWCTIVIGY
jgi:hypothetical protein